MFTLAETVKSLANSDQIKRKTLRYEEKTKPQISRVAKLELE